MKVEIKPTENENELILCIPSSEVKEIPIQLPYYTKCYLSTPNKDGTKRLYSVSKVVDKKQCLYVTEDEIKITFPELAFLGDSLTATSAEFKDFFHETLNRITKLI